MLLQFSPFMRIWLQYFILQHAFWRKKLIWIYFEQLEPFKNLSIDSFVKLLIHYRECFWTFVKKRAKKVLAERSDDFPPNMIFSSQRCLVHDIQSFNYFPMTADQAMCAEFPSREIFTQSFKILDLHFLTHHSEFPSGEILPESLKFSSLFKISFSRYSLDLPSFPLWSRWLSFFLNVPILGVTFSPVRC